MTINHRQEGCTIIDRNAYLNGKKALEKIKWCKEHKVEVCSCGISVEDHREQVLKGRGI